MNKDNIKFWILLGSMLVAATSSFVWSQAKILAAEEKIRNLTANTATIKLIQEKQTIDSAVYKEILIRLESNSKRQEAISEANRRLLQQISNKLNQ